MEMPMSRDIIAISIPFSAGVISAAYLPLGELSLYTAASLLCVAIFLCLIYICRRRNGLPGIILCLYLTGALVCFSSRMSVDTDGAGWQMPRKALESLTRLIERTDLGKAELSALLKALLTGDRTSLPNEITEAFRESGAAHILALSGLHMGIIYGLLSGVLGVFGRSRAALITRSALSICACAFYTLMTGASPSVVRAFLFILLNELGRLCKGRSRKALNILCTSLMIQLCISPSSATSVGFQLSYMAMLGIYLLYPILDSWWPEKRWKLAGKIWSSCALSISCQIFTAPLAWIYFRSFPVHFLITNLLALPLTEAFMGLAVTTLMLSALGICPDIMKDLTGASGQILIYCVETIASISS